jgi:hypothetical protein
LRRSDLVYKEADEEDRKRETKEKRYDEVMRQK